MVLMSNLRTMNTYSDTFLIDKLYAEIDTIGSNSKKIAIDKPEVSSANKRTFLKNFRSICLKLNRDEEDVRSFFEKELKTTVTISQDGALVITGMYKQNGIMTILTNYIKEFVMCKQCSSCDTNLIKDKKILFLNCNKCLSKHAIN
ncbi:translation initiation factor 2 subunit beta [Klosneuvirus KNV1]|uniref:Translation initiation factor 2 subunit beta n=1 Tax=Klosneuvirus KNV1 TaxID=1977640 RepID=A0A1V0SIN5_9VIRU|nr:translation initiation factor 2 subunit beta [Klosneuvirus KNV1]